LTAWRCTWLVVAGLLGGLPARSTAATNRSGSATPAPPVAEAGELIVQFGGGTGPSARGPVRAPAIGNALLSRYGVHSLEPVFSGIVAARHRQALAVARAQGRVPPDLSRIYLLHVDAATDLVALAAKLRSDPDVVWVEPNYLYHADVLPNEGVQTGHAVEPNTAEAAALPNDPFLSSSGSWGQPFPDLWGLFKIDAPDAWQLSQGEGVVVAVVDSGIDITHPDLAANVWHNPDEIPGNGIDDDGNGFVDDVYGWDFTHCVTSNDEGKCLQTKTPGPDVRDQFGHGTHVAGIIAAVGNNGIGIIGVAPRAQVMAVKGLDASGVGTSADLAAALVYAADNGAGVINASWGGPPSETIRLAVQYVITQGVVMVVSAGNDAVPIASGVSPADLAEVVAVGALTHSDTTAFFSNFGGALSLVAPGGGDSAPASAARPDQSILSLLAHDSAIGQKCLGETVCSPQDSESCNTINVCSVAPWVVGSDYLREGGTSMAAPHVSGVAALVRSRHPEFIREQVQQVLRDTADDLGPPGWDPHFGYGRVDAARAVAVDAIPVAEITVPGNGGKVWDWQFPYLVQGNAFSPGAALRQWRLTLAEQGSHQATEIARGSTPVTGGGLGTVELAQVQPGKNYVLTLSVEDVAGHTAADTNTFLLPDPLYAVIPIPDQYDGVTDNTWTISADGTRIPFESTSTLDGSASILVFDTTTHQLQQVVQTSLGSFTGVQIGPITPDGHLLSYEGFLPDGQNCAANGTSFSTWIVYDVDTGSFDCLPVELALYLPSTGLGAFDAHGRRVVFTSSRALDPQVNDQDGSFEVFTYDTHTNRIQQITQGPPPDPAFPVGDPPEVANPTISWDGRRIVFDADVDLDPTASTGGTGVRQVFLYDGATGAIRQLTGRPGAPPDGQCPSLSGDGRAVAFESSLGVFVIDLQTGTTTRLVDAAAGPTCPLLSADGKTLAVRAEGDLDPTVENEDMSREVFTVDVATGTVHQVTDMHPIPGCDPTQDPCGPLVQAIDAHGDSLVLFNHGLMSGVPLPIAPPLLRVVPRRPNQPPVLDAPGTVTAPVGAMTRTTFHATDPTGLAVTFYVERTPLPAGLRPAVVLSDHGDGTADLTLSPTLTDVGQYTVRVAAFNEAGGLAEQDVQVVIPGPTPSPTLTATATQSATATATPPPTHTPTPSPTDIASPTPEATATASQTPTPTASATASATATPASPDGGCTISQPPGHRGVLLLIFALAAAVLVRRRVHVEPAKGVRKGGDSAR
jgi:subtilisin family serine protease/Tol biopolymer transport system component